MALYALRPFTCWGSRISMSRKCILLNQSSEYIMESLSVPTKSAFVCRLLWKFMTQLVACIMSHLCSKQKVLSLSADQAWAQTPACCMPNRFDRGRHSSCSSVASGLDSCVSQTSTYLHNASSLAASHIAVDELLPNQLCPIGFSITQPKADCWVPRSRVLSDALHTN